jgi:hypothetical protein
MVSRGRLAQLGERLVRNEEAGGSNPLPSTKHSNRQMKLTHFQLMVLFALLSSIALGALQRGTTEDRIRSAAWTFLMFLGIGIAIAWVIYPFSH